MSSFVACTKSTDNGSASTRDDTSDDGSTFFSDCGTVVDGSLRNPVSQGSSQQVSVQPLSGNLLSVVGDKVQTLVKLQNIGAPTSDSKRTSALRVLNELATQTTYFIPASDDCSATLDSGSTGTIGQLFTASGKSYSEELLSRGLVPTEVDPCGGDKLSACYDALGEQTPSQSAGEVGKLLFKPASDSDGNLAVHSLPYGASVTVNGDTGRNQGPGNGYGSLARFSKPGCSYGSNITVEVTNADGTPYLFAGKTEVTVPNGCGRWLWDGSTLRADSK